jgi:hypothetical protein
VVETALEAETAASVDQVPPTQVETTSTPQT